MFEHGIEYITRNELDKKNNFQEKGLFFLKLTFILSSFY